MNLSEDDHCPRIVRLFSSFTVKAMLRKKENALKIYTHVNLTFYSQVKVLQKETLNNQNPYGLRMYGELCLGLCYIINYFHWILEDQHEGKLQRKHLPVSLCLGSGCFAQYLCPRCVSIHPPSLLQQQGQRTARDTNLRPLKFQIITQAGQPWRR